MWKQPAHKSAALRVVHASASHSVCFLQPFQAAWFVTADTAVFRLHSEYLMFKMLERRCR